MNVSNRVIVIGAGAAGMMAAGTAAGCGAEVLLLEQNERLGKKLYITGKGRCNVTNNCTSDEVLKNVPTNPRFLYSALNAFSPADTIRFFEDLGCPLKTERGNRVFPVSDQSADVIDALRRFLKKNGVKTQQGRALEILTENGHVSGVRTQSQTLVCDRVVLATGGCSYPTTGSTGDGYRFAAALGHTVIEPTGALVPLVEKGHFCSQMQGLALKNVGVKLKNGKNKTVYEEQGELLFTHFGLSGPTVLSASSHMGRKKDTWAIEIDLKPALDEQTLDARLLRDFEQFCNRSFANSLGELLPKSMIPVVVRRSGIDPEQKVNTITRQQRRTLLELLKAFRVEIACKAPVEEAIITSGGVKVSEVNPGTMESKKVGGLYLAGELLDVDAYTGGFNLQIAWATGRAAGLACAKEDLE